MTEEQPNTFDALAGAAVDAWERRDADALVALCDPEIEVAPSLLLGRRAIFRGHEGVRQWLVEFAEAVPLEPHAGSYQVSKLDDRRFELLVEIVVDGEPRASVSCMIRTNELGLIAELRSRLDALAGDT